MIRIGMHGVPMRPVVQTDLGRVKFQGALATSRCMKMRAASIVLLLTVSALAGCTGDSDSDDSALAGTSWIMKAEMPGYDTGEMIEEIGFDYMLPINLQSKIEKILKSKLKLGAKKKSIVEMIHECKDKGLVSNDAIHLLHIIRKQRNLFAHNSIEPKTRLMRVIFIIAAFSILSSEL